MKSEPEEMESFFFTALIAITIIIAVVAVVHVIMLHLLAQQHRTTIVVNMNTPFTATSTATKITRFFIIHLFCLGISIHAGDTLPSQIDTMIKDS